MFNAFNVFHLNLMDGGRQTLDGQVGDWSVHAILDTGAERNVMDSMYVPNSLLENQTRPIRLAFLILSAQLCRSSRLQN